MKPQLFKPLRFLIFLLPISALQAQIDGTPSETFDDYQIQQHQTFKTVNCPVDTVEYTLKKSTAAEYINLNKGNIEGLAQWYPLSGTATMHGLSLVARVYTAGSVNKTATLTIKVFNSGTDSLPSGLPIATTTMSVDTSPEVRKVALLSQQQLANDFLVSVEYGDGLTDNDTVQLQVSADGDGGAESLACSWYESGGNNVWLELEQAISNGDRDFLVSPWISYSLTTDFLVPNDTVCLDEPLNFTNGTDLVCGNKFFNQRIGDPGTYGDAWAWSFGDGNISNSEDPVHSYDSTGSYSILLTSSVSGYYTNCAEPASKGIVVADRPVAAISLDSTNFQVGDTVQFTDNSVGPGSCYWEFGDSTFSSACGNQSHIYDTNGMFTVVLTKSSPYGCQETDSIDINVTQIMNINQLQNSGRILVFPNPSSGLVQVTWPKEGEKPHSMQVIDVKGRSVALYSLLDSVRSEYITDLSGLPAGLYFIKLKYQSAQIVSSPFSIVR